MHERIHYMKRVKAPAFMTGKSSMDATSWVRSVSASLDNKANYLHYRRRARRSEAAEKQHIFSSTVPVLRHFY